MPTYIYNPNSAREVTYTNVVFVFTDGACIDNGKPSARAGWAIHFPDPELRHLSDSDRVFGRRQSNQRAELFALIRAAYVTRAETRQVVILTDSQYAINCAGKWLDKWQANGWKNARGTEVHNRDLICELDSVLSRLTVRPVLQYVRAHAGHAGNEMADRMAKAACWKQEIRVCEAESECSCEESEDEREWIASAYSEDRTWAW
ncbi:related to Ribonuclease H [Sporisorium reilianum f. sp. reilianum]|uniref:ribonuclease H n=1 Tax=Sporisorium reilianum f. sp. reilianum TaxID=72559 RepID=A0A2N8UBE1_9BASI|nr:related to Ribonuclease H [Sporisorium reilianum f. sp. reilianum]